MCYTVGEIAESGATTFVQSALGTNTYAGVLQATTYRLWDEDKNTACVCDTGYSGIDCSLRECPYGDDPLTWDESTCGGTACVQEKQSFSVDGGQAVGTYFLLFTDFDGTQYKTDEFKLVTDGSAAASGNEAAVNNALEGLPNAVTGHVLVSVSGGGSIASEQLRVSVTFQTKSGNIPAMALGWEGTSNPGKHGYIFQPSQPVHTFTVSSGLVNFVMVRLQPSDSSLFPALVARTAENDKKVYWTTDKDAAINIATTGSDAAVRNAFAKALNEVPLIDFAYGGRSVFLGDANVLSSNAFSGMANVTVAFPDFLTGQLPFFIFTGASSASPTFTFESTPLGDNVDGNKEAVPCSNRGICDYTSGLCQCFAGQTGVDCSTQSALARGSSK